MDTLQVAKAQELIKARPIVACSRHPKGNQNPKSSFEYEHHKNVSKQSRRTIKIPSRISLSLQMYITILGLGSYFWTKLLDAVLFGLWFIISLLGSFIYSKYFAFMWNNVYSSPFYTSPKLVMPSKHLKCLYNSKTIAQITATGTG